MDSLPEKTCPDPKTPSENHISNWNPAVTSNAYYEYKLIYSCKSGRKLQGLHSNGSKYLYDEQHFTCEWNQTWSPSRNVSKVQYFWIFFEVKQGFQNFISSIRLIHVFGTNVSIHLFL